MASDIEPPKRLVTLQRDGAEFVVSFYPDDTVVLADCASEGLRYASMENHQRRFECERHDARCLLRVEGRALTQRRSGRAMYQMMGVFAEFERAIIRERVMSGLARAKAEGITLGRPALEDADAAKVKAIKAALAAGKGIRRIAREHQAGVGTVMRIKAEMVAGRPFDDVSEAA